jgi:hypothetical protein
VHNIWSDGSFNDLLTLLKGMLPPGNTVCETIYEAKQIICPLGMEVERIHACKNDCILCRGDEYIDLENALFVDSTDLIVEKMELMKITVIEEMTDIKWCFGTFLSFLI